MTTAKSHKSKSGGTGRPRSNSRRGGLTPAKELLESAGSPPPLPAVAPPALPDAAEEKQASTGAPQELPPEKQSWWRPPDSKIRKKVEKIVVMRAAGRTDREIAKKLGTTEQTIRQDIYIAKKNGWLDDEGEPIDLEAELAINIERKVVRNISASLDGQMTNWQTHEMTIAAAKGRGIFKSEQKVDVTQTGMSVVAIQVIRPPDTPAVSVESIPADSMGGVPAYLEGEVEANTEGGQRCLGTPTDMGNDLSADNA